MDGRRAKEACRECKMVVRRGTVIAKWSGRAMQSQRLRSVFFFFFFLSPRGCSRKRRSRRFSLSAGKRQNMKDAGEELRDAGRLQHRRLQGQKQSRLGGNRVCSSLCGCAARDFILAARGSSLRLCDGCWTRRWGTWLYLAASSCSADTCHYSTGSTASRGL